jgi:transposase
MVIDRITHLPLYFRLVDGNIVDVSTLTTTYSLMSKFGVNPSMLLMDAGYYSEKNIRALFQSHTSFLTRLPAGRALYKNLIGQTNATLETLGNIVVYNKRSLYVQKVKTDVCGYIGFAYVCCDIKQRGQKMDKYIQEAKEDKLADADIAERIPYIGKFVMISDKEIDSAELLPLYYTRQVAENTFGFIKSSLNLLPLRVHSIENLRGYMFLSYLALLLSVEVQNNLKGVCTLKEALAIGHNQFCEVFGNDVIPLEPNKRLKEIYKCLGIVVVNSSGE